MTQKEIKLRSNLLKQQALQVNVDNFDSLALDLFRFQAEYNPTYHLFLKLIGINPLKVLQVSEIPFMPISLFKTQMIQTGRWRPKDFFASSGTSGQIPSRHYIADPGFYLQIAKRCFDFNFGSVEDYSFLGLLPNYLERGHSSLVAMINYFVQISQFDQNGFYLYEHQELYHTLLECRDRHIPTILIGVSYALIDFFTNRSLDFPDLTILETGGMKGNREEITKEELHLLLSSKCTGSIGSEYGMTELFSQAYAPEGSVFHPGPTLRPVIIERDDPLVSARTGKSGILAFIDLGNVDSCAFIQTQDIGRLMENGFEVLGRHDSSEWRGCNLMLEDVVGGR